jgi:uncharacterized linocin/CFP29 family protein
MLSGRRLVDVTGPLGLEHAAVNLGALEVPDGQGEGVRFGVRKVLPLVEVRVRFELDIWELDNVDRGSKSPDLDDLRRAASDLAKFEETSVYNGFPDAEIKGLVESSEHNPIAVKGEPASLLETSVEAMTKLRRAGVEGPYSLALGAELQQCLDSCTEHGYPLRKQLLSVIEGPIVFAPFLKGGMLVSGRGGDSELVLGQDIAIGYHNHDDEKVRLFFTESFAFRVVAPEAMVPLVVEGKRSKKK